MEFQRSREINGGRNGVKLCGRGPRASRVSGREDDRMGVFSGSSFLKIIEADTLRRRRRVRKRGVVGGCQKVEIMENGSVEEVRSEREFRHGKADRLARRTQTNEAPLVVAMREIAVRPKGVGKAVAAREPAWVLKTG